MKLRSGARRAGRGFTLVETLVTALLAVLAVSVVAAGSQAAARVSAQNEFSDESRTVADTVDRALGDVLRYASDVRTDGAGGVASYDCDAYGIRGGTVRVGTGSDGAAGQLYLAADASAALLNGPAYAGLRVIPPDDAPGAEPGGSFRLRYAGGVFSGSYRLYDASRGMLSDDFEFSFRAVNG